MMYLRFVHARRARLLRRRGDYVRFMGWTARRRAIYAWEQRT
jgi:hypothetical protein